MSELSTDGFVRENRFDEWTLFGRIVPDWVLVSFQSLTAISTFLILLDAIPDLQQYNLFVNYVFSTWIICSVFQIFRLKHILD